MRNPALRVLQKHGVVPAALGYKAWRETVSRWTESGRVHQDPRDESTAAGRLRRSIGAYVSGSPAREHALLWDLRSACWALGLAGPGASVDGDALAELLDNPWLDPPALASSGRVQLVECPGAATARYANEEAELDLSDLGAATSRYAGPPAWTVRQALRRRSGRGVADLAAGLAG